MFYCKDGIMSDKVVLGSLITEVKENPEDRAFFDLEQTRLALKNLVNGIYGIQKISTISDREILQFMHWFEEERDDLPLEKQEEIWQAFEAYRSAHQNYQALFPGETVSSTVEALRAIDPNLVGETSSGWWASLFNAISRWIAGEDVIARYQGRLTVLQPQEIHSEEIKKVLDVFPKFFATQQPVSTIEEMNKVLDQTRFNPTLNERREWFESYLRTHITDNIDYLLNRELTKPEEFFSFSSEEEDEVLFTPELVVDRSYTEPVSKSDLVIGDSEEEDVGVSQEKELVSRWDGEIARQLVDTSISAALMNPEMEATVKERLIPLDQIEWIEQSLEDPLMFKIHFKAPMVGSAPSIQVGGWNDIRHSPIFLDQEVTVRFNSQDRRIEFPDGGFQMAIHLEDLSFIHDKLDWTSSWGLSGFLKLHGLGSEPIHLATTIKGIVNVDEEEVVLRVEIHDKEDLPFPRNGKYPGEGALTTLKVQLNRFNLNIEEFGKTFANFTWSARS